MKQAIAWQVAWLFKVGIFWLTFLVVCVIASWRMKPLPRVFVVVGAVLCLPAYLYVAPLLAERSIMNTLRDTAEANKAISVRSSKLYAELCASAPPIQVTQVVRQSAPVDIEVVEPRLFGFISIRQSVMQRKGVCWLQESSAQCKKANVGNVEWSFMFNCHVGTKNCEPTYFRDDRRGNHRIPLDQPTAPYLLTVSEPERLDSLIQKYRVEIKARATGEVLATAQFLNKGGFVDVPRTAEDEKELPFCPDRDLHIAEMLSLVFPSQGKPQPAPQ